MFVFGCGSAKLKYTVVHVLYFFSRIFLQIIEKILLRLLLSIAGTPATEETIDKGLTKLKETIDSVTKATDSQPIVNPLELSMFDISSTSRLLPPSFPRTIQLMSIKETMHSFSVICVHLQTVNNMPKKLGLVEAMDYIDKFSYENPSILVRSLHLYHLLPTNTGKVFNKHRLPELVTEELRTFNSCPLFHPAYKTTLMSEEHVKLVLNAFLNSAAHVLDIMFVAKCNTRARQREKLALLLEELGVLQSEAERVDSVVDTVIKNKLGERALGQQASSVGEYLGYLLQLRNTEILICRPACGNKCMYITYNSVLLL